MIEKVENYMDRSLILRYFQIVFTYFSPLTLILTSVLTIWLLNYNRKRSRLVRLIEKIPGPPALPFIGLSNFSTIINLKFDKLFLKNSPFRQCY